MANANREPQPPQFAPAAEIAPKTIPPPQKEKPPLPLARFGYAADPLPAYENCVKLLKARAARAEVIEPTIRF